jgi:uncharacterized spore protein YtfJ
VLGVGCSGGGGRTEKEGGRRGSGGGAAADRLVGAVVVVLELERALPHRRDVCVAVRLRDRDRLVLEAQHLVLRPRARTLSWLTRRGQTLSWR